MKLKDFLKVCKYLIGVDVYFSNDLHFLQTVDEDHEIDRYYINWKVEYVKVGVMDPKLKVFIKPEDWKPED